MGSKLYRHVFVMMANSLDPDETARYEPSHQDLQCFAKVSE